MSGNISLKLKGFSVLIVIVCLQVINVKALYSIKKLDAHRADNERPIIGILSQELGPKSAGKYPHKAYIAASYVKYVESSGARVIPIWIGKNESYYRELLSKINGVVFPGGDADFNATDGYAEAGRIIYKVATEMNNNDDYFPILGICLGFELITFLEAGGVEHRFQCDSINQVLPLEFSPGFKNSRLFQDASNDVIDILKSDLVTANFHSFCINENSLKNVNLTDVFKILSTNRDLKNNTFISSFEHRQLPFYALQFHPEKNNFEWAPERKIPHSLNAIKMSEYFSNFFIEEARKSLHFFPDKKDEKNNLIYNYNATYISDKIPAFQQIYFFN